MNNRRMLGRLGLLSTLGAIFGSNRFQDPDPFGPVVKKKPFLAEEPMVLTRQGYVGPKAVIVVDDVPGEDPRQALERLNEHWPAYETLNFEDTTITRWNIDTRDFCFRAGRDQDFLKDLDLHKLRRRKQAYLHTPQEVAALFSRYYSTYRQNRTSWLWLRLRDIFRSKGDLCQYMRVYRLPEGLVVTNKKNFIFNKADLSAPIV